MDGRLSSSIQLCHSCTPEIPQGTRQYCNPEPIIMDTNRPQHGVLCTCVKIIWDYVGGPWFSMVSRYHGRYCSTCSYRTLRNLVWYPDTWNILVTIFQIYPIFSPEYQNTVCGSWSWSTDWVRFCSRLINLWHIRKQYAEAHIWCNRTPVPGTVQILCSQTR